MVTLRIRYDDAISDPPSMWNWEDLLGGRVVSLDGSDDDHTHIKFIDDSLDWGQGWDQ